MRGSLLKANNRREFSRLFESVLSGDVRGERPSVNCKTDALTERSPFALFETLEKPCNVTFRYNLAGALYWGVRARSR